MKKKFIRNDIIVLKNLKFKIEKITKILANFK